MMESVWMAALVGYGIGSVPFGYVLARFYGVDVRDHGSGNVGATNVTRLLGRWLGIITFVLDAGKGALAVWLFVSDGLLLQVVMICLVLGHMFPIWLNGRGGKGVAVLVGMVLVLQPVLLVALVVVWGIVFLLSGYVSLASVSMALLTPCVWWMKGNHALWFAVVVISLMIVLAHWHNMIALWHGKEHRFRVR